MKSDVLPAEFAISEKISIDYINNAPILKKVFPKHFREASPRRFSVDRERLVDRLLEYNRRIGSPKPVIENIEALSQADTHAVITGQQPGLFSGPMYTIYKAISAIIICERLSTKEYSLVPVFWNASEDHDLSEVNHINLLKENEPYEIRYDCVSTDVCLSQEALDNRRLKMMLTAIESASPETEFKAALLRKIEKIIGDASTIGDFFSRFMINLFGENGLVLVEPYCLRDLMIPIFERLLKQPTQCTRILNEAGLELGRLGYSPRIHKKPSICNFFLVSQDGKRERVTYNGRFNTTDESFSQKELLDLLSSSPSRFSANAVTRPITQDFLFPTFAYVAGPNEVAYLAQLKPIYDFFSLEMPVVFPRLGATIVERKISKVLEKYDVEIRELRKPEKLLKDLAKAKLDGIFNSFKSEVTRNISKVTQQAESVDATLTGSCSLAEGRILKAIETLEGKIASKLKEHNLIVREQITKAYNNIFPDGQLQERQVNVLEYLIKFGKEFLRVIYEDFRDADYGEHRVIKW